MIRFKFDGIDYNYQENPHRWERERKFAINFWGVLIFLAIMVGMGTLPWWILFIPFIQACELFISKSAAITCSHDLPIEEVRRRIKDIETNGI